MPVSLVQNESILAIEVGAATTRAVLFDVVEGQYRFVASGQAPTTAESPFKDIGIGVREAIISLQNITGSTLLGQDNNLIAPAQPDGSGVDCSCCDHFSGSCGKDSDRWFADRCFITERSSSG